jgi:predicted aspartyl protease
VGQVHKLTNVRNDARTSSATSTELSSLPRRNVLTGAFGAALFGSGARKASASTKTAIEPLADLPMVRLKLPRAGFGREYVAIKLKINGQGPFDFMVDSGLTTELITPHLQETLGIQRGSKTIAGLAAGGDTAINSIVELDGASLCCGTFSNGSELPLPNLHAVITDFPQEHIDPAHDPVEGMIGMEVLSRFDVDFDFPKNRIRFWEKGTTDKSGLVEIPAVEINETGLIGIRVSVPGARQPILGFLDCGASFSCMNWKGATQLGFPPQKDPSYKKMPSIAAIGVDGRMIQLPTTKQTITFAGEVEFDPSTGGPMGFATPTFEWKDWDAVQIAIGDIPAFSTILGDGITPYQGPAVLLGLDILSQRRVILEAGDGKSRRRRVFVAPR